MQRSIAHSALLALARWGLFQISGYHWKRLGYKSIDRNRPTEAVIDGFARTTTGQAAS